MVRKFEDAIKVSIKSFESGRSKLPKTLANLAINHFKDSFRKQGWNDSFLVPWKKRKGTLNGFSVSKKTGASRAILVKTGRLRRSFESAITPNRITITNDTPYGVYHNYGTEKLPQRRFMGKSRTLDEKFGVAIMRFMKQVLK